MTAVRIGLTLGDPAGIGPELLGPALLSTPGADQALWTLYLPASLHDWWREQAAHQGLQLVDAAAWAPQPGALGVVRVDVPFAARSPLAGQPDRQGSQEAFAALDAMAKAAHAGQLDAIVTGPVPKGIFDHLQPRPPGQTEFLAGQLGAQRFAMMLAGPQLRVVPITTHIPLRQVADALTVEGIVSCGLAAHDALLCWYGLVAPRLAVCGLNPHAGEGGRCGDEEARIIAPAVEQLQQQGVDATGPVVADTVFAEAMAGRWDAVLCMYHDQALGPLKTVHFHDGINLTCGLPVPRVSPDHGTAYGIAGRGLAKPDSTRAALTHALRFATANQLRQTGRTWG